MLPTHWVMLLVLLCNLSSALCVELPHTASRRFKDVSANDEFRNATDAGVENLTIQAGYYSTPGRRPYMEATSTMMSFPEFFDDSTGKRSLFAVYDGHGGVACADYCSQYLHEKLIASATLDSDPVAALREAVQIADHSFRACNPPGSSGYGSGSTAIIAYLHGSRLYVANVGDSRAVLSRQRGKIAAVASSDHTPNRRDERERIQSAGGRVCVGRGLIYQARPGGLSISRSIGDGHLKDSGSRYLICTPEVQTISLSANDEFLVLACNGVWDVLDSQTVVKLIRNFRRIHGDDPTSAAKFLANQALRKGSSDNISVLLVYF